MQKRKGFTLVELVIVIAVIAILAGVLIGTFASVINRANESAKLQEIKAQEIEQKSNDILKKIEDSNWYGWEDFETSIVDKISTVIQNSVKLGTDKDIKVELDSEAVQRAVSQAMSKYYAENTMQNTSLTEDQVKAIVENALGTFKYDGLTEEQVTNIVNNAVSKVTTGLSETQVQQIVDAAVTKVQAGQLSSAQITTIVSSALASNNNALNSSTDTTVNNAVNKVLEAINSAQASQLTAKQVEEIIEKALKSTGDTSWIDMASYQTTDTFTLDTAEEVTGLATLVNGGYDFDGKTVELKPTDTLTNTLALDPKTNWTPIGNSYETQFKGTLSGGTETNPLVITGLTLDEQFKAVVNGFLINCSTTGNMDKVGVGFVAYLGDDAVLENIIFDQADINIQDPKMDGISIGVAVGYLDGGTIRNVKVTNSSVKAIYSVGGLCGAAGCGTIENCSIENTTLESTGYNGKITNGSGGWITPGGSNYHSVGGLIGYARQFDSVRLSALKKTVTITNTTLTNVKMTSISVGASKCGSIYGRATDVAITNDGTSITISMPQGDVANGSTYSTPTV